MSYINGILMVFKINNYITNKNNSQLTSRKKESKPRGRHKTLINTIKIYNLTTRFNNIIISSQ